MCSLPIYLSAQAPIAARANVYHRWGWGLSFFEFCTFYSVVDKENTVPVEDVAIILVVQKRHLGHKYKVAEDMAYVSQQACLI